ncbi:MAG: zinc-ribbon domain-containing protein [Blastocatellia bacterium]
MYCPSCANPIEDNQKFCRACGANVSLVPHALTGQLPILSPEEDETTRHGRRKRRKLPTIENAVGNLFTGVGFLVAALFVTFWMPRGYTWGWAFLFPAFAMLGEGVGQYLKVKQLERERERGIIQPTIPMNFPQPIPPQPRVVELSAPTTSELATPASAPASIAEHTTKNLNR